LHCGHELVDETHVFVASDAILPEAEVERVVEQGLVVRADIENDRQAVLRRDACTSRAQSELPNRDAHAPGSEIAQAEDAFAVGHHDKAHVLVGPVLENVADPAACGDRQIDAPRLAEDMGEFLAGFTDRRRVDQRHVGGRVGHQHRVKQRLVAGLQV
jgi:hypothetical protein